VIRQLRSMPNLLTLLRLFFIPFIIIAIVDHRAGLALSLFIVAGVSDALDGLLARLLHQRTKLGEYLDPIADKLLLSSLFLVFSLTHRVAWRITVLVFSRDILILVIGAVLYMTNTVRDMRPSLLGKLATVVQVVALGLVLLADVTPDADWILAVKRFALRATVVLTVLSGMHYMLLIAQRLRSQAPPRTGVAA
jgi:cardiolipin synthase (CMP-forming)